MENDQHIQEDEEGENQQKFEQSPDQDTTNSITEFKGLKQRNSDISNDISYRYNNDLQNGKDNEKNDKDQTAGGLVTQSILQRKSSSSFTQNERLRHSWTKHQKSTSGLVLKFNDDGAQSMDKDINKSKIIKSQSTISPLTTKRKRQSEHTITSQQLIGESPEGARNKHSQQGHEHGNVHTHKHTHKHSHSHGHSHGQGSKKEKSHSHNGVPCVSHVRDDSILQQNVFKTMNYDAQFRLFKVFSSKPKKSFLIVDQRKHSRSRGQVAEINKLQKNANRFVKQFQNSTQANFQSFVKNQEEEELQRKHEQRMMELKLQVQGEEQSILPDSVKQEDPAHKCHCHHH